MLFWWNRNKTKCVEDIELLNIHPGIWATRQTNRMHYAMTSKFWGIFAILPFNENIWHILNYIINTNISNWNKEQFHAAQFTQKSFALLMTMFTPFNVCNQLNFYHMLFAIFYLNETITYITFRCHHYGKTIFSLFCMFDTILEIFIICFDLNIAIKFIVGKWMEKYEMKITFSNSTCFKKLIPHFIKRVRKIILNKWKDIKYVHVYIGWINVAAGLVWGNVKIQIRNIIFHYKNIENLINSTTNITELIITIHISLDALKLPQNLWFDLISILRFSQGFFSLALSFFLHSAYFISK